MSERATLYSDPNCPFCYATEVRLHALGLNDRVEWHGVEHSPELAVPMAPSGPALAAELPAEVESVAARAPEVEIAVPPGKPKTELAIRYGAAALRRDPAAGRDFVRSLYRAFWADGADLSDPAVLDRLADAAGLDGLAPDDEDTATARGWRRNWERTGLGGVPLIIRADGRSLYGLVGSDELAAFL